MNKCLRWWCKQLFNGYSKDIPLKAKDFSMCDELLQTLLKTAIFECFAPDRLSTELRHDLFWQKLAQFNQDVAGK
jgi:hypothetical protein